MQDKAIVAIGIHDARDDGSNRGGSPGAFRVETNLPFDLGKIAVRYGCRRMQRLSQG
jgi:hypothetical protein